MKKIKKIASILSLTAGLLFSSCEHKELCYDHRHFVDVEVVFDWKNAPDADPTTMDIYFVPEEGGAAERFQFAGKNGGRISVPLGRYNVVGINSDSETNQLQGTGRWETFEVRTVTTSLLSFLGVRGSEPPRAEGTENERTAYTPDRLWSTGETGMHLTDPTRSYKITLYPERQLCNYMVKVLNVTNLKYARDISGALSSMAGGLLAGSGELTKELVTMSFPGNSDMVSTITSNFHVFGHCPTLDNPHKLTIYAVLADGSRFYKTFDVTDQVHGATDRCNVEIVIDGLELPKPIINGGGFNPDVDEWTDGDEIEIPM